ncbi:MAG: PAS domain-containing protein [Terrimicrobiaceae bacterium]
MSIPLRALIAEDSEEDTLLLLRELKRGGYEVTHERVETPEGLRAALAHGPWEILLCDYTFPRFSGKEALQIFKESGLDLPFIYVSGTIGEEAAVEAMKAGAHDYVMKNRISRLCPAVERELREAVERQVGRAAENAMRVSENKYRHLFEALSDAAFVIEEISGRIIDTNAQAEILLGRPRASILGSNQSRLFGPVNDHPGFELLRAVANGDHPGGCDLEVIRQGCPPVPVHASASWINLYGRRFVLALLRDASERARMDESSGLFLRAMEQCPLSVVLTDAGGKIIYVNRRFIALTGYSFAEAVGTKHRILQSAETPPRTGEQLWQVITSGPEWSGEFENRKKSGELFRETVLIYPLLNNSGRITHFFVLEDNLRGNRPVQDQASHLQSPSPNSLTGNSPPIMYRGWFEG